MKANSDYYQIITGKITELEVTDTNLSLFGDGSFASLPLLGQLALGNSAEAASQVGMASGQEEAADYLNESQVNNNTNYTIDIDEALALIEQDMDERGFLNG
jgi:hypothetical protein